MKFIQCVAFLTIALGIAQTENQVEDLLQKALETEDSSAFYFSSASKLLNNRLDSANYGFYKFMASDRQKQEDSTLYYAEMALPILELLDSLGRMRRIYERLHFQELRNGSYDGALEYAHQAMTIAERMKDTAMISLHLSDKSIVYHDFEDYERGVEYGKKAFNIMVNASEIQYRYLLFANNATAINFDDWGKPDSALYYHFENMKYLGKVEDTLPYTFVFNNIGNTYLKQKKFRDAKIYMDQALALNKRRNRPYNLASNYTNLATIAYEMNDYPEAKRQFVQANHYAQESQSIEKIRDVVQQEAWFYEKIGDYEKALERSNAYYELRDSIFNRDRAAAVAEIETKYETEKKERALAQTRADLAERELQVKRKNTLLFGSLGFALLLGLSGYLLFSRQRLKTRQLRKESELKTALAQIETQNKLQEQRLRISRDLHDNIGSQLTFVTSSVDSLKYRAEDEVLSKKLGTISQFTTQTIYELRDTIWAMNKQEITCEDLQTRIANFIDKAKSAEAHTQFEFEVEDALSDITFSSVQGMNIYRVIQEAVNNALKYADANQIAVRLAKQDDHIVLSINDNGGGFDPSEVPPGNGLQNIKKRVADLKGESEVRSKKGEGTTIRAEFPVRIAE